MDDLAEACYDDRFDVWKVDLYAWDDDVGTHVHEHEEGEYGSRGDAAAAAEDLASEESALLRIENEAGSVVEERRPR